MLTVRSDSAGDVAVIKCVGRIVRGQENILRDAVIQQKVARVIVVDLSEVESIDAGGLTVLVDLHRWTENNRSHLKLVNPRPFVHQMLTRTHLSCVFDISSFDEALSVLGCERGHERERERRTLAVATL
jgi:anti-anti-sigma factor